MSGSDNAAEIFNIISRVVRDDDESTLVANALDREGYRVVAKYRPALAAARTGGWTVGSVIRTEDEAHQIEAAAKRVAESHGHGSGAIVSRRSRRALRLAMPTLRDNDGDVMIYLPEGIAPEGPGWYWGGMRKNIRPVWASNIPLPAMVLDPGGL